MLLCRMEPYHLVNLLTRQLSLKNIQTMKYSYYQNKKQPPCAEVTDEEVANLIRHDEKLAHMTLDIRQHITANDIATADTIKGELPSVTFSARFTGGRRYDKLTEYNGEIVLDLDKKSPRRTGTHLKGSHRKSAYPHQLYQSEGQRLQTDHNHQSARWHPAAISRRSPQLPCACLRPGCFTLRRALPDGHRRIGQRHDTHLLPASR